MPATKNSGRPLFKNRNADGKFLLCEDHGRLLLPLALRAKRRENIAFHKSAEDAERPFELASAQAEGPALAEQRSAVAAACRY
jgi:hypothetical protein